MGRPCRPEPLLLLQGHIGIIRSVAFSAPDGRRIVTSSDDHTVKVWDARTGQEVLDAARPLPNPLYSKRRSRRRRPAHRLGQRGRDGEGMGRERSVEGDDDAKEPAADK